MRSLGFRGLGFRGLALGVLGSGIGIQEFRIRGFGDQGQGMLKVWLSAVGLGFGVFRRFRGQVLGFRA